MVFFVKSVKHTFYTLHTIIPDFGDVRKLTGYSPFTYKGKGFGKAQLSEAVRRIKEYEGLKEIRVWTNSNLIAPKNYESVGFVLYDKKENNDEATFSGDYLYYKIQL